MRLLYYKSTYTLNNLGVIFGNSANLSLYWPCSYIAYRLLTFFFRFRFINGHSNFTI